jgi:hypothetical protein
LRESMLLWCGAGCWLVALPSGWIASRCFALPVRRERQAENRNRKAECLGEGERGKGGRVACRQYDSMQGKGEGIRGIGDGLQGARRVYFVGESGGRVTPCPPTQKAHIYLFHLTLYH